MSAAATPTPRQLEVLRAIHEAIVKNGWPPTIRELGEQLGIGSTNGVNDHPRRSSAEASPEASASPTDRKSVV